MQCVHISFLDINECSENIPCDLNAGCVNTEGSFNCTCMAGYTGNGTQCGGEYLHSFDLDIAKWSLFLVDINECLQEHACQPHSTCTNFLGTFSCTCNEGFSASDNNICEGSYARHSVFVIFYHYVFHQTLMNVTWACSSVYLRQCVRTLLALTCAHVCLATPEMAQCVKVMKLCLLMFMHSIACMISLSDVDECNTIANLCYQYATCTNVPGSYSCQCDPGFTGNGTSCTGIRCN